MTVLELADLCYQEHIDITIRPIMDCVVIFVQDKKTDKCIQKAYTLTNLYYMRNSSEFIKQDINEMIEELRKDNK